MLGTSPLLDLTAASPQPPSANRPRTQLQQAATAARGRTFTAAVDEVTKMSRCNLSTTVKTVGGGGSCPSRLPIVFIVSEPSGPPSPILRIVTEPSRRPLPSVFVVKEEARSPSFCFVSSKHTSSPTTVYVVSEGSAATVEALPFAEHLHRHVVGTATPVARQVHRDGGEATVHCD
ncbi:hypothetical protein MRX96_047204 [Rhipicephalus microplus]